MINETLRKYIQAANMLTEEHYSDSSESDPRIQMLRSFGIEPATLDDNGLGNLGNDFGLSGEDFEKEEVNVQQLLEDLIFKLRSYQDPDMGDYAAGVEAGMSRAADMIQNLLSKLQG